MHINRRSARPAARRLALGGVSALVLATTPALAQQAAADEAARDTIIVTARTFQEDIQDVPVAVSALTATQLERQGIKTLSDVARNTSGFSFENFTGALAQPTIRGQTNLRVTSPVTNVASYVDGIYLQRAFLIDQSLLDLARVEIIKGPQSALYGRNAFAGVVNMVLRKPDLDEFQLDVTGGIGTDKYFEARGTLSVPVIPGRLAILAHVAHQQFDGTIRNSHPLADASGASTRGKLGGYNNEAYQVGVLFEPLDALRIEASYVRTDRFMEHVPNFTFGTASALTDPYNYNNCSPVLGQNRLYCGKMPSSPSYVTGAPGSPILPVGPDPRPDGFLIDPRGYGLAGPTDVVSAKVELSPAEPLKLTYQLGYTSARLNLRGSTLRNPLQPLIFGGQNLGVLFDSSGTDSSFKGWSHDMRATYESEKILAFVGANYSRTKDIESNASETYPLGSVDTPNEDQIIFPVGPGLPFPTAVFQRRTFLQRDEDILGLYGFIEFRPTEQLRFSAEGRYTIEDRTAIDFLTREPSNPTIQALAPPRFRETEKFFAPRFSASYALTPDNLLYASVARGVKAGGFNGFVPFAPQKSYAKETNWTYEVGSKNVFPDIGLTLNAAVYHVNWQDLQTTEVRRLADGSVPVTFFVLSTVTGNVGSVKVWGAEIDGVFEITDGLKLNFGASYNNSRYKDGETSQRFELAGNCDGIVCPTGPVPIGGNQVERIPAFDGFAGLGYEGEFGTDRSFYVRGDVTYQSKQYVDEVNLSWVPDRFLVNAQAGVSLGPIDIRAYVKNLFNKSYVSNSLFLIGTAGARSTSYVPIFGERRTAVLSASYRF